MKKLLLTALLLACFLAHAYEGEHVYKLTGKAIMNNSQGYFVLSDGSCWWTIGFEKRWRSLGEWWSGITLNVPQNYECIPADWYLGAEVKVFPKYEYLDVNEADASNQETLKRCTNLLMNPHTGHILFAVRLEPETFLVNLYNDAFADGKKEGYDKGYSVGWYKGYEAAKEAAKIEQLR